MSLFIYGSCVLGDFKLGWSDVDILVLTKQSLTDSDGQKLLGLRQELVKRYPKNQYFRSFEGGILPLKSFLDKTPDKVVYWGTKGEKIKDLYNLDSFSMKELLESGILIAGDDVRNQFTMPSYDDLYQDVYRHYLSIREHAQKTGRNLYSFGWLLDISRCIYTLQTGEIIAKTEAGEWALKNKLCPDEKDLRLAVKVRKNPKRLKQKISVMDCAETFGPSVQRYADVLQKILEEKSIHF